MTKQEIISIITPVFENLPIEKASIFGSYARNDSAAGSDVDLVLQFTGNKYGLLFSSLRLSLKKFLVCLLM